MLVNTPILEAYFLDLSKKNISEEKEQNYSNIEIDEDEFKAVDASKIYAETIGKTPPVQAEDVAEEPKDESSIMNGAQEGVSKCIPSFFYDKAPTFPSRGFVMS